MLFVAYCVLPVTFYVHQFSVMDQSVGFADGQVAADAKIGKGMSRDDNERVIAQMVYDGYIQFDFGYTAYATNSYLKATQQSSQLLQGVMLCPIVYYLFPSRREQ